MGDRQRPGQRPPGELHPRHCRPSAAVRPESISMSAGWTSGRAEPERRAILAPDQPFGQDSPAEKRRSPPRIAQPRIDLPLARLSQRQSSSAASAGRFDPAPCDRVAVAVLHAACIGLSSRRRSAPCGSRTACEQRASVFAEQREIEPAVPLRRGRGNRAAGCSFRPSWVDGPDQPIQALAALRLARQTARTRSCRRHTDRRRARPAARSSRSAGRGPGQFGRRGGHDPPPAAIVLVRPLLQAAERLRRDTTGRFPGIGSPTNPTAVARRRRPRSSAGRRRVRRCPHVQPLGIDQPALAVALPAGQRAGQAVGGRR